MPVIWSGNGNNIHLLVIKYLADILYTIRGILKFVLHKVLSGLMQPSIWVNQVGNSHILLPPVTSHVGSTSALDPTDGHINSIIGPNDFTRGLGSTYGKSGENGGLCEEGSSVLYHDSSDDDLLTSSKVECKDLLNFMI